MTAKPEPCSPEGEVEEAKEIKEDRVVVLERMVMSILERCNLFTGNKKKKNLSVLT